MFNEIEFRVATKILIWHFHDNILFRQTYFPFRKLTEVNVLMFFFVKLKIFH